MGVTVVSGPNAVQPMFFCPSRRSAALYPIPSGDFPWIGGSGGNTNYGQLTTAAPNVAKTDYAGNGGDSAFYTDWRSDNGQVITRQLSKALTTHGPGACHLGRRHLCWHANRRIRVPTTLRPWYGQPRLKHT